MLSALCGHMLVLVLYSLSVECCVVLEGLVLLSLQLCICLGCIFWVEYLMLYVCVVM